MLRWSQNSLFTINQASTYCLGSLSGKFFDLSGCAARRAGLSISRKGLGDGFSIPPDGDDLSATMLGAALILLIDKLFLNIVSC